MCLQACLYLYPWCQTAMAPCQIRHQSYPLSLYHSLPMPPVLFPSILVAISLSLSLSLSCSLSLLLALSLSLFISASLSLSFHLSIVCLPLSVYNLCMSVSVCVCVSLSFTLSHTMSFLHSLSVCVSPSKQRPCLLI